MAMSIKKETQPISEPFRSIYICKIKTEKISPVLDSYASFTKSPKKKRSKASKFAWGITDKFGKAECDICGKQLRQCNMLNHMRVVHINVNKHTCMVCQRKFRSITNLRMHLCGNKDTLPSIKTEHISTDSIKIQNIKTKPKPTDNKKPLRKKRIQNNIFAWGITNNLRITQCDICERELRKCNMLNHMQKVHMKPKKHICSVCSNGFDSIAIMKIHTKSHSVDIVHTCRYCGGRFQNKAGLHKHMSMHPLYIAEKTQKHISSKQNIQSQFKYLKIFTQNQQASSMDNITIKKEPKEEGETLPPSYSSYSINFVDEVKVESETISIIDSNTAKSTKILHKPPRKKRAPKSGLAWGQTDTYRTVECDICKKQMMYRNMLRHMQIHINHRKHICSICQRGFNKYEGLKKHFNVHSEWKEYICRFCGAEFNFQSNLVHHIRTHTGKNQINKCKLCDRHFSSKTSLNKHKRQVHGS